MDESISGRLIREYEEETGLKVKVGKLLGISEDFFTFKGTDIHGILIYYKVEKQAGKYFRMGMGRIQERLSLLKLINSQKRLHQDPNGSSSKAINLLFENKVRIFEIFLSTHQSNNQLVFQKSFL